ncbi:MAG: hypothetical protein ACYSTF_01285 [Planctomycetota bacterium]|jgi:hypothetical protein
MPINTRTIAISVAVICFFILSLVGWISGLSPFTCWKRATIGAMIAYVATVWAVKAINAILMNAIITSQMNRQKETGSGSTDSKDY